MLINESTQYVKNINIGLMGHVDSGKTSIAKCLSSIGGTACFDKSPQSQSRGITLDLGFSTFKHKDLQVTLVDCPGHASLIRTVLCGAQIIDLIVLVIDGTKGIQAQTAECLIVAEIMTERLVFVVNKIDLWSEEERQVKFELIKKKLRNAMKDSKFADMPIVPFSASLNLGIEEFKEQIDVLIEKKPIIRNIKDDFVFVVDHCFPVKGQGTVLTGTVLQGKISINEMIEINNLKVSRKIKSIQSFRENVKSISAGDRAGICVQSIESDSIERTLISSKPLILSRTVLLLEAKRVKYYKNELKSKSKIHISVLNESVLCKQILIVKPTEFGFEYFEKVEDEDEKDNFHVIIELEKAINILPGSIVIGSKFDYHPSLQKCRIAFHGRWTDVNFDEKSFIVFKLKHKYSLIDRIVSDNRLICKGLTSELSELSNINVKDGKESISKFIGMKVSIFNRSNNLIVATGVIDSLFGTTGKFNVTITDQMITINESLSLYCKLTYGKVGDKRELIKIN